MNLPFKLYHIFKKKSLNLKKLLHYSNLIVLYKIKFRTYFKKKRNWVAGRVACLGQDVLILLDSKANLINIQKGRIDYITELNQNKKIKPNILKVESMLQNKLIITLIEQQIYIPWYSKNPPLFFLMDSYSELTDQLFENKINNWRFCSNYNDLLHDNYFHNNYHSKGLLDTNQLIKYYKDFFFLIRKKYKNIPIFFLHFPVKLDARERFKFRYIEIKHAIDIISIDFKNFYSIEVPEEVIDWPEIKSIGIEDFPYHFNKATYLNFALQIKNIISSN
jgi:hypothetical protein